MDTPTLVDGISREQIEEGQRLLDRLRAEGFDVHAACWLREASEGRIRLYIASSMLEEKGLLSTVKEVIRILHDLGYTWLTISDVLLIGPTDPVAREAIDLRGRFPGLACAPPGYTSFGGIPIERSERDVYNYSLRKEPISLYGMSWEGMSPSPLNLSFKPHDPNSRMIVEAPGEGRREYSAVAAGPWIVAAPDGSKLTPDLTRLAWSRYGRRVLSSANEVWSLAHLGLQGFSFVKTPDTPPSPE